jgi:hypothetical protein
MHYFVGAAVAKHAFYSIRLKIMFGSVSKHFTNLRHVKRKSTYVSGLNAIFRSIEVAMHPFYSIRPKMMFGRVLHHFAIVGTYKMKNLCFGAECTISRY